MGNVPVSTLTGIGTYIGILITTAVLAEPFQHWLAMQETSVELHEITSLVASVALESRKKKGAFKHTGLAGTVKLSKVLCTDRFLREGPFLSIVPET
ncbi:hypothetical protein ACQP3J_26805, partial [Escherichia coli]